MVGERERFKQHLQQLQEVITSGISFYAVWNKLRLHNENEVPWSLDSQNQMLGRWSGFFTPVGIGLQRIAMLEFAKVFDGDTSTVSLTTLLNKAKRDSSLILNAKPNDLNDIAERLRQGNVVRETIIKMRNQRLAHADGMPDSLPPLMNQEVESLIEDIKFAFNRLSVAHDLTVYSWDFALRRSDRETTEILRLLVNEMERKETEFNDKIVEIVGGHVRAMETTLGRPLDEEELESVLREFAPTADQSERIRRAHRA